MKYSLILIALHNNGAHLLQIPSIGKVMSSDFLYVSLVLNTHLILSTVLSVKKCITKLSYRQKER
jgi:hypothetical protein